MNIAVIIPCYNEEITIEQVIKDYKQYFNQIYVIDNNCTDNTAKIAKNCGAIVIREDLKGKGAAVRTAFEQIDADIVVLTDGDATYFAKDSVKLVERLVERELDMVVGNRISSGYFKHNQKIHGLGNNLFCKIATNKYNMQILDLLSGSRAITKDFYKNIEIEYNGFEIETELTKKCAEDPDMKLDFVDIDYVARPKDSKSSINIIKDGLRILRAI